jgi:hypothetical protein
VIRGNTSVILIVKIREECSSGLCRAAGGGNQITKHNFQHSCHPTAKNISFLILLPFVVVKRLKDHKKEKRCFT